MDPYTIITGQTYDYNLLLNRGSQYGEYAQTHKVTDNTMKVGTIRALIMRPTGNAQVSFYYFSLATGYILHFRRCTPLPIPSTAIDRVHAMATTFFSDRIEFLHADNTHITPLPGDDAPDDAFTSSKGGGMAMVPIVLRVAIIL